jgi:hypothetical protein
MRAALAAACWSGTGCCICGSPRAAATNSPASGSLRRAARFSAHDHRRYYGLDFADRPSDAGFQVEIFRVSFEEEIDYGLSREEWSVARKSVVVMTSDADRVSRYNSGLV